MPTSELSERGVESDDERAKIIKSQGTLAINQIHYGGDLSKKEYSWLAPAAPSADIEMKNQKKVGNLQMKQK